MSGSGGGPTETALPTLRWVAFVTGYTPNDDYAPIESEGVGPDLLGEVKDVCVAFHPHNEVRLFPTLYPVYLFWCARTTGEYVVTRVSLAANTTGVRKTLDYFSVLLPPDDFARLGNDPFRTKDLALHDHVRERLTAGERSPIGIGSDASVLAAPSQDVARAASPGLPRFLSGGEQAPTPETLRELERYCRQASQSGGIPLTFATWWESGKRVPDGYFEIVMRVRPPRHNAMTLHGAEEVAISLAADIQAALPRNARDTENERLHRALGGFVSGLIAAVRSAESLTSEEFRRAMADAAERIHLIGGKILSVSQATAVEEAARLEGLSRRCDQFAADLPRLHHLKRPGNWRSEKVQIATPAWPPQGAEINEAGRRPANASTASETSAPTVNRSSVTDAPVPPGRAAGPGRRFTGAIITAAVIALLAATAWYWQRESIRRPAPAIAPPASRPAAPVEGARREAPNDQVGDQKKIEGQDTAVQWILSHDLANAIGADGMTLAVLASGCEQVLGGSDVSRASDERTKGSSEQQEGGTGISVQTDPISP